MDSPTPESANFFINILNEERNYKLFGPSILQILKLNGKLILLFGDQHNKFDDVDRSKFTINYFTNLLIENIPACIDIFIESAAPFVQNSTNNLIYSQENKPKNKPIWDSELIPVILNFWESLGNYKTPINTNYNRIHNIDIRKQINKKYNLINIPVTQQYVVYYNLFVALLTGNMTLLAEMLNYLHETNIYNDEDIINESSLLKIHKQYEYLPLKNKLMNVLIDDLNKYQLTFDKDLLDKYILRFSKRIGARIMDLYALSRILKSIYVYNDSAIIIAYAGSGHTMYYAEKLIEVYNAELLYQSKNDNPIQYNDPNLTTYEIDQLYKLNNYISMPIKKYIVLDDELVDVLTEEIWKISQKQNRCSFKSK